MGVRCGDYDAAGNPQFWNDAGRSGAITGWIRVCWKRLYRCAGVKGRCLLVTSKPEPAASPGPASHPGSSGSVGTTPPAARVQGLASLVEQTARTVHDLCWTADMQAAQWSALRYFGNAGERTRNVVGLAKYQGTNPGTASRTIAALTRRGLLVVAVSPDDKRARIVSLTDAGRALLAQDPLQTVERAIAAMSPEAQADLGTSLRDLLGRLLTAGTDGSEPKGDGI